DVDAIAEQIAALNHDVAKVDADAEAHALRFWHRDVLRRDRLLDLLRAAQCLDRARKLRHEAVTGLTEDSPTMEGHYGVYGFPVRFERAVGSFLVFFHVTGVAGYVGAEDSR